MSVSVNVLESQPKPFRRFDIDRRPSESEPVEVSTHRSGRFEWLVYRYPESGIEEFFITKGLLFTEGPYMASLPAPKKNHASPAQAKPDSDERDCNGYPVMLSPETKSVSSGDDRGNYPAWYTGWREDEPAVIYGIVIDAKRR